MYTCDQHGCSYRETNLRLYTKHLRRHEQAGTPITLSCPKCQKRLPHSRAWSRHLRVHEIQEQKNAGNSDVCEDAQSEGSVPQNACREDSAECLGEEHDVEMHSPVGERKEQRTCGSVTEFILKLRARNVPQDVCDEVVGEMKAFASQVVSECSKSLQASCTSAHPNVDAKSLPSVAALYAADQRWKQDRTARRDLLMIEPDTVVLGHSADGKAQSLQFVPVTKQLEALLADPSFKEQIVRSLRKDSSRKEGQYSDVMDGTAHSGRDRGIGLIFYYDEFQVSCPVGNKTKKYDIGGIYFAVANMPRRSRQSDVHLAMLFHKSYVKKYSWETILQPLLDDVKELEEVGVNFSMGSEVNNLKGFIELFVGDNLALHQVAGYFCSFRGTQLLCRFCHATHEDMQSKFHEGEFVQRTKESYESELKIVEEEGHTQEVRRIFGINRRCPLNDLSSFHCAEQMPVDASHDLFEGIVLYTLNCVLTSLLAHRLLDAVGIDRMVAQFPYHATDINKPQSPCFKGLRVEVKETCSEAWTFVRLLPLMVKAVWQGSEPYPEMLCTNMSIVSGLVEIVQIIMANVVMDEDVEALQIKIQDWLSLFRATFPESSIRPKMHYLLHYPSQIRKHGPPSKYCTIRFESKHQELKGFLRSSKNRRNVCKTMANKHQLKACVERGLHNIRPRICDIVECEARGAEHMGFEEHAWARRIVYDGTRYSRGDVLVMSTSPSTACFVKIEYIAIQPDEEECNLFCVMCRESHFEESLQAFRVSFDGPQVSVRISDLADHHPLGIYRVSNEHFVVMRYTIPHKLS